MVAASGNLHRLPAVGDFRLFFRLLQGREQFFLFGVLYCRDHLDRGFPCHRNLVVIEKPKGEIPALGVFSIRGDRPFVMPLS